MATRRKRNLSAKEFWIGLAKVEQRDRNGVLGDADGAYTNAIAIADGTSNFRTKVSRALTELGLRLTRLENAETLKARLSKHSVDPELTTIAKEAIKTGQVRFGTFHAFDEK